MTDTANLVRFDANASGDAGKARTSHTLYRNECSGFRAGFWAAEPGRLELDTQRDEFCTLLEGRVRVTDASGATEIFVAGDTFVIPHGFKGVWETLEPSRKFFAIRE